MVSASRSVIGLLRVAFIGLCLAAAGCSHMTAGTELTDEESAYRQLVAAKAGDGEAAYNVAVFYYKGGLGLPKDWDQARFWFARAAELGDADAQCDLGSRYERDADDLFKHDVARAKHWYEQCMFSGEASAYYSLGRMHDDDGSLQLDTEKSKYYYMQGVELQEPWSMLALGVLYAKGRNLPQDYVKAVELWERAAQKGVVVATYEIGLAHSEGKLANADNVEALKWFSVAAETIKSEKKKMLAGYDAQRVARALTDEQITQAKALASQWIAQWVKRKND